MPVTLVSQNILRETLQNEISLTKGFEDLSKALLDIASNRIAMGLQGESDDARLSESLDKFKRSVIDKAWSSKIKIPADTASDYIDRYFAVRAHKLQIATSQTILKTLTKTFKIGEYMRSQVSINHGCIAARHHFDHRHHLGRKRNLFKTDFPSQFTNQ